LHVEIGAFDKSFHIIGTDTIADAVDLTEETDVIVFPRAFGVVLFLQTCIVGKVFESNQ
jgi:hypothetical protein